MKSCTLSPGKFFSLRLSPGRAKQNVTSGCIFYIFLSHLTGRQSQSSSKPSDQNKMRRAAEREGRRARRRKHREKEKKTSQPDTHHEGQSTDDEETETDAVKFRAETSNFLCYYIQDRSRFPQHPINELII